MTVKAKRAAQRARFTPAQLEARRIRFLLVEVLSSLWHWDRWTPQVDNGYCHTCREKTAGMSSGVMVPRLHDLKGKPRNCPNPCCFSNVVRGHLRRGRKLGLTP